MVICLRFREAYFKCIEKGSAKGGNVNELQTQPMNAPSNQNSTVEDYTPVYVTATMHHLKMVMVKTLNHPQPLPHIRSLWLSKELSSQIFHIPCEVDTGTSSNILPLDKANSLLEQIPSWDNRQ
ncbi:unnamed protein product [Porites lobata]|uniref:Uncharacterized protein n=1 Tax=Porites lobata TaxID=104759 RepID=A0ABN8SAE4_9CNID|nr:unnamed protein product [Porites lobata]